ncbi:MAG: flagellar filament capping protein FliD [Rhodocyclaceae bacterium]|nr:flagellar filament capping protein FliD [Rhodocyclaceae bacterium]
MAVTANTFQTGSVSGLYSTLGAIQRDRFSRALERPTERLAQETESVRVRLSAFGQARSATATVQASARELQNGSAITSAASAKEAAGAFVESVNSARTTLKQLAESAESGAADSARARIAGGQLERLVADNASALREVGIRVQEDGALVVDAKALEAAYAANPTAVKQTFGDVGRAAEATATRQLSASGSVGAVVDNLSDRLQQLETRETDFRERAESAQKAVEASSRRYGFGAVGAGAYLGIFGL